MRTNMTISECVKQELKGKDFIFAGSISRHIAGKLGHKESTIDRELRYMQNDGLLEAIYVDNPSGKGRKVVCYRLKV